MAFTTCTALHACVRVIYYYTVLTTSTNIYEHHCDNAPVSFRAASSIHRGRLDNQWDTQDFRCMQTMVAVAAVIASFGDHPERSVVASHDAIGLNKDSRPTHTNV